MNKIIEMFWKLLTILFPHHICSICMDTTLFKKKHELCCGHVFHTDCIMSWFRTKKNTCPYCRCTGTREEPIINNNITEFINNDWELHEYVQSYIGNENPTKDQIINAYYIRDINMNIDIESVFNSCVRYLRINPEDFEKQIQEQFKRENTKKINDMLKRTIENPTDKIEFNYSLKFNEYLLDKLESEEYSEKLKNYHKMEDMRNENNHVGIYRLLNCVDLQGLGW